MRAKIIRMQELIESFIGTFDSDFDGKVEVYDNPQTISKLQPWIRGCSDEDGNLYVADSQNILHYELASYLTIEFGKLHLIDWQRYGGSNTFYLAEGYDLSDVGLTNSLSEKEIAEIEEMAVMVKNRNKQYEFIHDKTILNA